MRISELAEQTGVSRDTLKFYLREGVLHPGRLRSRTQADYDGSHIERVRLVRSLVEVGGLPIASVRGVVQALEHPPGTRHDLLGAAQAALGPAPTCQAARPVGGRAAELISSLGWDVDPRTPLLDALNGQLDAAASAGVAVDDALLGRYARSMHGVAEADLDTVPDDPSAAVRQVVVGTILIDAILATLRRLAQQDASARRMPAHADGHGQP